MFRYIPLIIGALLLLGSYGCYNHTQNLLETASVADGVVVDVVAKTSETHMTSLSNRNKSSFSSNSDSVAFYPVVAFSTGEGQPIVVTSSAGSNPPSYHQGDHIPVYYEVNNPHDATVGSFFSLWGFALVLGIIGTIFSLIGVLVICLCRRKTASKNI